MTLYTRFDALTDGRVLGLVDGLVTGSLAYADKPEVLEEGDWRGHYLDLDTGSIVRMPQFVPEIESGYSVRLGDEIAFQVPPSVNVTVEHPDGSKSWGGQTEQDGVLRFRSSIAGRYRLCLRFLPHPYRDQDIEVTVNAD